MACLCIYAICPGISTKVLKANEMKSSNRPHFINADNNSSVSPVIRLIWKSCGKLHESNHTRRHYSNRVSIDLIYDHTNNSESRQWAYSKCKCTVEWNVCRVEKDSPYYTVWLLYLPLTRYGRSGDDIMRTQFRKANRGLNPIEFIYELQLIYSKLNHTAIYFCWFC